MTSRPTSLLAPSVRRFDSVFGVPMLDGFARRRNTIFSACIGFSEDLFRLRRRIVAPTSLLLRQESVGPAPHSLSVGFVTHGYWFTRLHENNPSREETSWGAVGIFFCYLTDPIARRSAA